VARSGNEVIKMARRGARGNIRARRERKGGRLADEVVGAVGTGVVKEGLGERRGHGGSPTVPRQNIRPPRRAMTVRFCSFLASEVAQALTLEVGAAAAGLAGVGGVALLCFSLRFKMECPHHTCLC